MFLVINIVIPIVFLSLINPVVFLLPHESGERVAFSVTILLSFTVILNVVSDNVPKTSSPMPLLCHYVVIALITSGTITVLNTLLQKLYHARGQEQAPKWLKECLRMSSGPSRSKVTDICVTDEKPVLEAKGKTVQENSILWKDAVTRLDLLSFIFFAISAAALAIGYIASMNNFQSGGLEKG